MPCGTVCVKNSATFLTDAGKAQAPVLSQYAMNSNISALYALRVFGAYAPSKWRRSFSKLILDVSFMYQTLKKIPLGSLYSFLDVITSEQIRAARALTRITVSQLSESAGVGVATIKRLEAVDGVPPAQARTLSALQKALESAGVEFIGSPSENPGVRLKTKPSV